jgi:hypothetical protein
MSIEIVLLPLAIAAISAYQAKRDADATGRQVVAVETRMKNEHLLEAALADIGATVSRDEAGILAEWHGLQDRDARAGGGKTARFVRNAQGIWTVHVLGEATVEEATELVRSVDAAYGRRVQQDVLTRLRARAPEVGMTVESETVEDDDSVLLTLNVGP